MTSSVAFLEKKNELVHQTIGEAIEGFESMKYKEEAEFYQANRLSKNTLKAYKNDLKMFEDWCKENNRTVLPASVGTMMDYVIYISGKHRVFDKKKEEWVDREALSWSSIERKVAAINFIHMEMEYPLPTSHRKFKNTMEGIRRELGVRKKRKKPLMVDSLLEIVNGLDESMKGIRDKALLLLGWAGGMRRSEIVSLDVEDIEFTRYGMKVLLKRSKTDQDGKGQEIIIQWGINEQTCPVLAVQKWLEVSGIEAGAVFVAVAKGGKLKKDVRLMDRAVSQVVKKNVEKLGLDPKDFGGHSLRAGVITQAKRDGKEDHDIMKHSRHKTYDVYRQYIREDDLVKNNITRGIGL